MVHLLKKTRVYLAGPMENSNGRLWRQEFKTQTEDLDLVVLDPYKRVFLTNIEEDESTVTKLHRQLEAGEFDKVAQAMKEIRSEDLRCCDIADFGIVELRAKIATFGTVEEISWFNRCKKPVFVFVENGKKNVPLWLLGMIPHYYIFDSLEDIITVLRQIDQGQLQMDSRWKLLKENLR